MFADDLVLQFVIAELTVAIGIIAKFAMWSALVYRCGINRQMCIRVFLGKDLAEELASDCGWCWRKIKTASATAVGAPYSRCGETKTVTVVGSFIPQTSTVIYVSARLPSVWFAVCALCGAFNVSLSASLW